MGFAQYHLHTKKKKKELLFHVFDQVNNLKLGANQISGHISMYSAANAVITTSKHNQLGVGHQVLSFYKGGVMSLTCYYFNIKHNILYQPIKIQQLIFVIENDQHS